LSVDDTDTNNAILYITGTPPVIPDFALDYVFLLANNLSFRATINGPTGAENVADGKKYTLFQSPSAAACGIAFNAIPAAYQRAVDTLIIDNHNLSGVNVGFAYSDDGSSWYLCDSFTPSDNLRIIRRIKDQVTHPYYALNMAVSSGVKQIHQVWFGQGWLLERPPTAPFDPEAERWEYSDFETESGVSLRYHRFRKRTIDMNFQIIQSPMYANIKTLFNDFETYGGFCWFCWRPKTSPSDFLYMIHKVNKRAFPFPGGTQRQGSISLEEVLG
jgi:hypothetical protein